MDILLIGGEIIDVYHHNNHNNYDNLIVLVKLSDTDYRVKCLRFTDTQVENMCPDLSDVNLSSISTSLGCGNELHAVTTDYFEQFILFTSTDIIKTASTNNCIIAVGTQGNITTGDTIMSAPSKACDFLSVKVRYRQSLANSPSPKVHLWR